MSKSAVNVEVKMNDFSSFEQMLKKFTKKVKKSGILEEYLAKRFFKSKSQQKYEHNRRWRKINNLQKQGKQTKSLKNDE